MTYARILPLFDAETGPSSDPQAPKPRKPEEPLPVPALLRAAEPFKVAPREPFPFAELPGGLPRGAVTEISGADGCGKTELVLRFLASRPELRVAWIENQLSVYPCAFSQHGVDLSRVLFTEAGADTLWATQQILRSQLFGVVVLRGEWHEALFLRRLQLAAEQAHAAVVLLPERPTQEGTWPIMLQAHLPSRKEGLRVIKSPDRVLHLDRLSRRVS